MVEHATERVIAVTARSTLDGVLDILRDAPPGSVVLALDPLSVLFSTPDDFRALDSVRIARSLAVTVAVSDPHRTGLALAFGYCVRAPATDPPRRTHERPVVSNVSPDCTLDLVAYGTAAERPDPPEEVTTPVTRRGSALRVWKPALIAVVTLGMIVAGAALLVWKVHTALIIVVPAEQSFSRVVPFGVSVVPTDDPNAIQTTPFETTITREGDAPATGKATVPDGTAAGPMTFRSRADGATTIRAGATLKGPRDTSYTVLTDIVVPGLDFVRGQLGEATARVRATQAGPAGNLAAGFSARFTENLTYISGDIGGGTEKQVPVVSEDDIAAIRSRLEGDLRARALMEVTAALPSGVTALNDYLTLGSVVTTTQPTAGTAADSVHVRVALPARLPVYRNADFDALIERRLGDAVHEAGGGGEFARTVLPATVTKSKPVFVDVQGPLVRYFATVTGKTRSVIVDADVQRLRAVLVGKSDRDAARILAGHSEIDESRISYGPRWLPSLLRSRMPRSVSHLSVHVETS